MRKTTVQKAIEGLVNARKYLKQGWTQGWLAKKANRNDCDPNEAEAVCWCASGALQKAIHAKVPFYRAYDELEHTLGGADLVSWNDQSGRTKSQVVDAFTRTISRLRRQEARK